METLLRYSMLIFAALFVAKMIWLGYLATSGKAPDDDEDGPVSGWGTPRG